MPTDFSYSSASWRALSAQARARDDNRCTVSRLLGGDCSRHLDAHHLVPVREDNSRAYDIDNVITVCDRHHPQLEALRRSVVRKRVPRCRHRHVYPGAREACERRLARQAA